MLTEKEIDNQFNELDKYLRWLGNAGLYETWDILMTAVRTDHYYIFRREIK
ncbi:hypothetical protein LCGC14_1737650 [marine sediment metagenome]|uniref:Uncharacterized protein n=1 Tax=marine sediment metagenome TaxID=412755 RepID=A0A0F9JMY2_9ZZZZ